MADEADGQDTGAEALGAGVDPAAVALALGGASREKADGFLDDQRALIADQRSYIDIQMHHLHKYGSISPNTKEPPSASLAGALID